MTGLAHPPAVSELSSAEPMLSLLSVGSQDRKPRDTAVPIFGFISIGTQILLQLPKTAALGPLPVFIMHLKRHPLHAFSYYRLGTTPC
jgi:uncharacterized protein (DUF302 family)